MGGGMGVSTLHLQIRVVDSQCVYSRLQTRALLTRADTLRLLACSPQALPRKELAVAADLLLAEVGTAALCISGLYNIYTFLGSW
jgi:hypothetical protein